MQHENGSQVPSAPPVDITAQLFAATARPVDLERIRQLESVNAELMGQIAAINRAQAVIEFSLDGTVLTANANFLGLLDYSLGEIRGKHHRMFVDPAHARSAEYREFWADLVRGECITDEFKRIGKGGKVVWIQASYNPILDLNGRPCKVVKFAVDITAQVEMRTRMGAVIDGVSHNAKLLGASSAELCTLGEQMTATATDTAAEASSASAASEEVSRHVQTLAAGTEEMSASIREIARNAAEAARVASAAVAVAAGTNAMVLKLGDSSSEIGKVIKVITSIAQQTNLLALNATIEAARAGQAGKGFAVVANEVKELAKETAKATEDISHKIATIQQDTQGVVAAISQISAIIVKVSDIQTTIAGAVEEQTATTNEMRRNVAEAAKGASGIVNNVSSVATTARTTSAGAARSLEAARELTRMATELDRLVNDA